MRCTKRHSAIVAAGVVVALLLLSAKAAPAADRSAKQDDFWSDGAPLAGGPPMQLAQRGPEGGPPRGPREGDDDRPPPGRPGRGMVRPGEARGPEGGPRERMDGEEAGPPGRRPDGDRGRFGGTFELAVPPPESRGGIGMGVMGGGFGPGGPHGPPEMMKDIDPQMYELLNKDADLERQSRALVVEYRRAPSDAKAKLRQEVTELVNKHFDVRQQRREVELKRLEDELKRLRETIVRRASARKELVEKRVSDLIGREEELSF